MASDGSDNPILDMGLLGMMQPNPYIDPAYAGKPLKLQGFRGAPTDAYGKVIGGSAPPPGTTTLNTPGPGAVAGPMGSGIGSGGQPAGGTIDYSKMGSAGPAVQELLGNYQASQAKLTPQQQYAQQQSQGMRDRQLQQQNTMSAITAAQGGYGNQPGGAFNPGQTYTPTMMGQGGGGAPAAPASGPAAPGVNSRQAYLDYLSNPGPPKMVGAAVPASTPLGTPSVLNAFMAAHPSGGVKGAGGYDNSGFFSTLSNLRNA